MGKKESEIMKELVGGYRKLEALRERQELVRKENGQINGEITKIKSDIEPHEFMLKYYEREATIINQIKTKK